MCLSVRGIQYFSHQNPHLNHCFYRGLWILPWGTKIYAPSIQHKMEYRADHILGKTFNIYFLSVYFPKLLSNLWQCQGRSSMMWSCCWNIWSIGMALFIAVLDNQTSIRLTVIRTTDPLLASRTHKPIVLCCLYFKYFVVRNQKIFAQLSFG